MKRIPTARYTEELKVAVGREQTSRLPLLMATLRRSCISCRGRDSRTYRTVKGIRLHIATVPLGSIVRRMQQFIFFRP
jgi:hypothetical protein